MLSCGDSEEDNFDLVGVWRVTMIFEDGVNIIEECETENTIEFISDGSTIVVYYENIDGTGCEMEDTEIFTWKLSGNQITIGDETATLNIINNNSFELIDDDQKTVFVRN
jgi:lipopolysaccharide export LptBFGC system permease protein LptF